MKVFDCVVIGGGPAGLSAAIYLARFNRKVVVVDKGHGGRWQTHEVNENYFGFPEGIHTTLLREQGVKQAKKFGTLFEEEEVINVTKEKNLFRVHGREKNFFGKTIIFATGVADYFPEFDQEKKFLGRSLFWCITCDGHKTINKRVLIVGNNDEAACTCLQFKIYTDQLTFLTNCESGDVKISNKWMAKLKEKNVRVFECKLRDVIGKKGMAEKVVLENDQKISIDYIFSLQGSTPHSTLAKNLGVDTTQDGYIQTDLEQRTNLKFVYGAGDVTKYFTHQIATAVAEGATAAQAANYDLYDDFQRI